MAMVHEELDTVLLGLDGVLLRAVEDLEPDEAKLISARGARVRPDRSAHRDRGLLRELNGFLPSLFPHLLSGHHALDDPGPVADERERDLPVRAEPLHPSGNRHLVPLVSVEVPDLRVARDRHPFLRGWSLRSASDALRRASPGVSPPSTSSGAPGAASRASPESAGARGERAPDPQPRLPGQGTGPGRAAARPG